MIAISSIKPWAKCSDEVVLNQKVALKSWEKSFEQIILVPEKDGVRPTIKELAKIGNDQKTWSCIVNSDIVVLPKLKEMERMMFKMGASCGVSRRLDTREGRVIDGGLDFFCALPHVWGTVAERIPEAFTIGRIVWDTWMLNYLSTMYSGVFYDLTNWAFIYHPKHEGREDQNWEYPKDDLFLKKNHWPKFLLPV